MFVRFAGMRVLAAAAIASVASVLLPAIPVAAAPVIPFVRGFQVVNVHSGRCLTVVGDTGVAVRSPCLTDPAYLWRLRLVSFTALFQVQNLSTGRCLTIAGGGLGDNDRVVQDRCVADLPHTWVLDDAKGAGFHIKNARSGKCLTIAGGNGASVQYRCDTHPSRRWTVRLVGRPR